MNTEDFTREDRSGDRISLYTGIDIIYFTYKDGVLPPRCEGAAHGIHINYCRSGQIAWKTENGSIYQNPGDFSIHTADICDKAAVSFPTGQYSGLTVIADTDKAAAENAGLSAYVDPLKEAAEERFCVDGTFSFLAGNEQTESIFSAFYDQPRRLRLAYQKIKVLELFLCLSKPEFTQKDRLTAYRCDQIETVREVHEYLTQMIGKRITIEELSKKYLINPTTLKSAFKAVYGNSIAAHMKEHRMEQAIKLLRESDISIAETARLVGYDSQSRFTAAFKAFYGVLPREYKRSQ